MARKRPIDVAFPELPHEGVNMSWRDTEHPGDWHIQCGDLKFCVHRIIVTRGPRASGLFRSSCHRRYNKEVTDLTHLVPASCFVWLEHVLDYVYDQNLPAWDVPKDIVRIWKLADLLQIKPLFEEMLNRLNEVVEVDLADLPSLLREAWALSAGPITEGLLAQVAKFFFLFGVHPESRQELLQLPICAISALLKHDQLQLRHEDDVFHFVSAFATCHGGDRDQCKELWTAVRFESLSENACLAAQKLAEEEGSFPCRSALLCLLGRIASKPAWRVPEPQESQDTAAEYVKRKLVESDSASTKQEKKLIVVEIFSFLVLQGQVLLNSPRFKRSAIEKASQLAEADGWRTSDLFRFVLTDTAQ